MVELAAAGSEEESLAVWEAAWDQIRITIITKRTAREPRAASAPLEVECKEAKKHLDPEGLISNFLRSPTKWRWVE